MEAADNSTNFVLFSWEFFSGMGYQWQEGTTGIILNFSSNKMRADSEECVYDQIFDYSHFAES